MSNLPQGRLLLRRCVGALVLVALALASPSCKDESKFTRVVRIESMAQTIGGPAAAARPGDFLLENDRIRAVVHGRHNQRSTFPIGNGSLVDLDLQRPAAIYGNGRGKDAFYELGPMVNLKINSSIDMRFGTCDAIGASPCPAKNSATIAGCQRVSASGSGDTIFGILALLDLAITRAFPSKDLQLVTDYDLCPGEAFVRITTTARFEQIASMLPAIEMPELTERTGLLDVLLGETSGVDCAQSQPCPPTAPFCDDLLVNLSLGSFKTEMKRCRSATQGLSGVLAGDFAFFSAKARVFIPGNGFDHETFSRSVFDTGGDIFSNPMALDFVSATSDDVSYVYFNETGKLMVPIFSEAFTLAMSNRLQCPRDNPGCFSGKELRFRRYVSVGRGDVGSALEGFYQVRGVATGRVEGHVIDARSRKPVTNIDVYVFAIPALWTTDSDAVLAARTYKDLVGEHRRATQGPQNPIGDAGMVSHFRTDPSLDTILDGSFGGSLPVGRYLLVTRDEERPASALVPVQIVAGQTAKVALAAAEGGVLEFELRDEQGRGLPAKLTFGHCFAQCARNEDCKGSTPVCDLETRLCTPPGGFQSGACRVDQVASGAGCTCPDTGRLPLELGGRRFADNTVRTVFSGSGRGRVSLAPGTYEVIASRGIEYDISRQFVTLVPNAVKRLVAVLPKVVDTKGWISADFHVHGPNSVDSGLDFESRVVSYAAEGVQLISSSDHDQLTNYAPAIYDTKLQPWLKSQIGVEISPLDYGHFIGFPLKFDERLELRGGFHWRADSPGQTPDWKLLTPGEIFAKLREHGSIGDETIAFIAHFYDHFEFFSVDPWTLEPPSLGLSSIFNPVLAGANFSGGFDALEVLNGKNLDVIRRPTRAEVTAYNTQLTALLAIPGLSFDERLRRWAKLSSSAQRDFLRRTPAEQEKAIAYDNPNFACRCTADDECGPGSICDRASGGCITRCLNNQTCVADKVAAGREACLPTEGAASRQTCQRVAPACNTDAECAVTFGSSGRERCLAAGGGGAKSCEIPCRDNDICQLSDPLRPVCDVAAGRCVRAPTAGDLDPCPRLRGTIDDWFQMLNRGVRRTLLANSDSHSVYDTEAGLPRSYVQSDATTPSAIRDLDIARAVRQGKVLGTYGPFVELRVNGMGPGSIVPIAAGDEVAVSVRVQSPLWFDVDRIEIYKNGQLWKEVQGKLDCARGASDCIKVPNDTIVKFDGRFADKPDRDAWYVVLAMGLDGKALAPVYSSTPVARLGTFELIQRLTPLLPPLRSLRIPFSPTITLVRPFAATNPVYVDVGGDGLTPVSPLPSWATAADKAAAQARSPLTVSTLALPGDPNGAGHMGTQASQGGAKGPSHDHSRGLGRMTREAKDFLDLAGMGKLDGELLRRAYEMLKQLGR